MTTKDTALILAAMARRNFHPNLLLLALSMVEVHGVDNTIAAMELEAESGFEVDFEDILVS